MATDLTARFDEETKKARVFQATPVQEAFAPPVPSLGTGLNGMARTIAESGAISPPANGVITADSAKAAVGNDMQRSGGISGGIDMAGVNGILARENKVRGEMQDMADAGSRLNSGTGAAILADSAGTEIDKLNAERTARWAADDLRDGIKRAGSRAERSALGQALSATIAGQNQMALEGVRQQGVTRGQDMSFASEIGRQGITARGQDLNAISDANRNAVTMRGQDLGANTDAQRIGIDRSRLEMAGNDQARAADKWGIERGILQGQAADSELVRGARAELTEALASGDPTKVEAAKAKAVAAGIKFDKPNNEFTAVTDSMGMNVTRTNKDTGAVDIINPKTGEVKNIPAPSAAPRPAAPVPQGYSVVGTSGGKRVLQDASGKRFVEGQ